MHSYVDSVVDSEKLQNIISNMEGAIYGKRDVLEKVVCALISKGHVLIEDIPGVGKTLMVNALSKTLKLSYARIQCTPDVMPSDIIGFNLYNIQTGSMEFKPGMIINHLVLADEINRAAPKSQSSFLEAMEEDQISVDGVTYMLPQPFMVLATQNPIEFTGTYPLPEAQLDRFMIKVSMGYPDEENEMDILTSFSGTSPLKNVKAIADAMDIIKIQESLKNVYVTQSVKKYILSIVRKTREHPSVLIGASPRATLALLKMSQAYALIRGREYVTPDDVQQMSACVICHRLIVKEVLLKNQSKEAIINEIIASTPIS